MRANSLICNLENSAALGIFSASTHHFSYIMLVQTASGVSQLTHGFLGPIHGISGPLKTPRSQRIHRTVIICQRFCESDEDRDFTNPGLMSHEGSSRPVSRTSTTGSYSISAPCSTTLSDVGSLGGSAGGRVTPLKCVVFLSLCWIRVGEHRLLCRESDRWAFDCCNDGKRNIETPVNAVLDPKEVQRTEANVRQTHIRVGVLVPCTHYVSHVIQKTCL